MSDKRFEVLEKLPTLAPHAARLEVRQSSTGRRMELRAAATGADQARWTEDMVREISELARVDHPSFPTLIDVGNTRGSPYCVVTLKEAKPLPQALQSPRHSEDDGRRMIVELAGAMAAAHIAGVVLGPPSPKLLTWDRLQSRLMFLHLHAAATVPSLPLPEAAPADCKPEAPHSSRADVFHWAWLSLWILSGGKWKPGQSEFPLRARDAVPGVSLALAQILEACLARDPKLRPAHAVEIRALMGDLPRLEREAKTEEQASALLEKSLGEIRTGSDLPSAGREVDLAGAATAATEAISHAIEDLGQLSETKRRGLIGLGLVAVCTWVGFEMTADVAPPAPPTLARPAEGPRGSARDPYLRLLARVEKVTPENFLQYHRAAVRYAAEGRLPEPLRDLPRLQAMGTRFEDQPESACRLLQGFFAELAEALEAMAEKN